MELKAPIRLRDLFRLPIVRVALYVALLGVTLVTLPPFALLSYDLSYLFRPAKRDATVDTVLIVFNESTLQQLGARGGMLDRQHHASLLKRLAEDGAALVVYDVIFEGSNNPPSVDLEIANAVRQQGNVLLAVGFEDDNQGKFSHVSAITSTAPILEAAKGWGHVRLPRGIIRQIPGEFHGTPYLGWVAATNKSATKIGSSTETHWFNFYGPPEEDLIPIYRLEDIQKNIPAGTFKNKVVFVGQRLPIGNVASYKDSFPTPYSQFGADHSSGVSIHATAFLNLVRGDHLRLLPLPLQWIIALGWAATSIVLLQKLKKRSFLLAVAGAVVLATGLLLASMVLQWKTHWWWAWAGPVLLQPLLALILLQRQPEDHRYLAFISYRNSEDHDAAYLVARTLNDQGYSTFIDDVSLKAGRFDEQLLKHIEKSKLLLLFLSPRSLVRCAEPDDWVLREISHAMSHQKTIIPIFKDGFTFEMETVPRIKDLENLPKYQGIPYTRNDFEGFMRRLTSVLK